MNEITTDIYFDLKDKEKDKDNDANTNEITNRDSVSLQNPIWPPFPATNTFPSNWTFNVKLGFTEE